MRETKLGFKIYYLSKLIHNNIDKNRSEEDFTGMQGRVLHFLLGQEGKCEIFQKDIEFEFQIKRSTATELLKALEEKEYIKRVPTSYDGRLKRIYLLPKAKYLAPKVEQQVNVIDEIIKADIAEQDLKIFTEVLDKMIDNMKKVD